MQLASYKMFMFQVDAMLHKLEKEIDDVDAKIGDRWRLLEIGRASCRERV